MQTVDSAEKLLTNLIVGLSTATSTDLGEWARRMVHLKLELAEFSHLLYAERTVAMRFSWLLTGIGELDAGTLRKVLPVLFADRANIALTDFPHKFAKYWLVVGIPEENEAEAIDLMFTWLGASDANVSTRRHCAGALLAATKKYPDLRGELKLMLEEEREKHSADFRKLADRYLAELA